MDNQPKNPPTVDRLTNQLRSSICDQLCLCLRAREDTEREHALEHRVRAARDVHERKDRKAAREQHRKDRQAVLRAIREELGRLAAQREPVEHTGRAEEERVAGGECGREDRAVDDVREHPDARALHRDDVRRVCCVACVGEQAGVVIRDKHACDENPEDLKSERARRSVRAHNCEVYCMGTYVEDQNTPEDSADGLGDVATRGLRLGCCDRDEFHSLERECSAHDDGEHAQETVESDVLGLEAQTRKRTRIFPVLRKKEKIGWFRNLSKYVDEIAYCESETLVIGRTAEINDETSDDQHGNQ